MGKLSEKQKRFCDEYLIDLNATRAYKRAGYKGVGNSAEVAASQLLRNIQVAKYLKERIDQRAEKTQIDAEYVLRTIKTTVERCAQSEPVMVNGEQVGEYKFDAAAVLKGAELLGRHLKMFTDKTEVTGKDGGAQKHEVTVTMTAEESYRAMLDVKP